MAASAAARSSPPGRGAAGFAEEEPLAAPLAISHVAAAAAAVGKARLTHAREKHAVLALPGRTRAGGVGGWRLRARA
eukprot:2298571-Prymnesium_polylepis.1